MIKLIKRILVILAVLILALGISGTAWADQSIIRENFAPDANGLYSVALNGIGLKGDTIYPSKYSYSLIPDKFLHASNPNDTITLRYNGPMDLFRNIDLNSVPAPNLTATTVPDVQGAPISLKYTSTPNSITVNSTGDSNPTVIFMSDPPSVNMVIGGGKTTEGIPSVFIGEAGDYLTLSISGKVTSVQNINPPEVNGQPKIEPYTIKQGTITFNIHDQLTPNNDTPVVNNTVEISALDDPTGIERIPIITGTTDNEGNFQGTLKFQVQIGDTEGLPSMAFTTPNGDISIQKNSRIVAFDSPLWIDGNGIPPVSWQTWEKYAVDYPTWLMDRSKIYTQDHGIWNADVVANGNIINQGFKKDGTPNPWVLWPKNQYLIEGDSGGALVPGGVSNSVNVSAILVNNTSGQVKGSPIDPTTPIILGGIIVATAFTRKRWLPLLLPPDRVVAVAISLADPVARVAKLHFHADAGQKKDWAAQYRQKAQTVTVDVVDAAGKPVVSDVQITMGQSVEVTLPDLAATVLTAEVREHQNVSPDKSTRYEPEAEA